MKNLRSHRLSASLSLDLLDVGDELPRVADVVRASFLEDSEVLVELVDEETHCDPFWIVWDVRPGRALPGLVHVLLVHERGVLARYDPEKVTERVLEVAYAAEGFSQLAAVVMAAWRKCGVDPGTEHPRGLN